MYLFGEFDVVNLCKFVGVLGGECVDGVDCGIYLGFWILFGL